MSRLRWLLPMAVSGCILLASHTCRAVGGDGGEGEVANAGEPAVQAGDARSSVRLPDAQAFRVLPPAGPDAPEITPYLQYQTALAWHQDALRRARWSEVKSEADLAALRKELRTSVLEMIGSLPTERTTLHATITGKVSADGFHVEKLLYQSLPGLYVTALVYVPEDGATTHPAVLVAAGHSPKGKIYYQDLCQRLVKRGYLVLSWDPIGQGERSQFWDAKAKKSRYNLICAEHAVMGNLAYLAGTNLARWEVWDGMRAVDYLLSRPDVDRNRISLTGTSGGGFQTALLGALDDRIKGVIPSCYITALPMRIGNRIFVDPDSDPEQDLFGFVSRQVDHAGLLLLMYPRAVMVAAATQDFFPVQGAQKSFTEVHELYQRFGRGDRIAFAESYNPHQFSLKNQAAALNFLDRFNAMPLRQGLPAVTAIDESQLLVTRSGQVLIDYPDAHPLPYYIAQYASEHQPLSHSTLSTMDRAEQNPHVSSWTVKQSDSAASAGELHWQLVGSTTFASGHIDRFLLRHSTYLAMPMLHIYRDSGHSKGAALWIRLAGKANEKDWPNVAKLLNEGYEVYSFDFRGLGEDRMHYRARSEDDPDLVKGDAESAYDNPLSSVLAGYVYNSLLTGRPYFFQLIDDLRIAKLFVRAQQQQAHEAPLPIALAAIGEASFLAVQFNQIDPDVKLLPSAASSMPDWPTIVRNSQELWPIEFLLPGGGWLPDVSPKSELRELAER